MGTDAIIFYVLPFILAFILYGIFKEYKIDFLLFVAATPLSIFIGTWGNLTGAIFLCFSFYTIRDKTVILIILICAIISIFIKMLFDPDGTIPRTFNYIIGYAYIILIYFILIHPKKINLSRLNEDEININIINLLISGDRIKEIADKVYLSHNAVTKRIEKMRVKYNCRNNEQLVLYFVEKGNLRLN